MSPHRTAGLLALVLAVQSAAVSTSTAWSPRALSAQEPAGSGEYAALDRAFADARPDPSRVGTLTRPVVLSRPGIQIVLREGRVALVEIGGRVVGATFSGTGSATVVPSLGVERSHLARLMDASPWRAELSAAALLFTDGTLDELLSAVELSPGEVDDRSASTLRAALERLRGPEEGTWDPWMMSAFLNRLDTSFFHAHMRPEGGDDVFYRHDARQDEEVSFGRMGRRNTYEEVVRFHPESHYADGSWRDEEPDWLAVVRSYVADVRIDRTATRMAFDTRVALEPRRDGPLWIPAVLHPDLHVDSARWTDGTAVAFHRPDDADQLWIRLPDGAVAGESLEARLWYRGDFGLRRDGWYGLKSSTGWYPRYGQPGAAFDLTFHAPSGVHVVSVGTRVDRAERGDTVVTRWVTDGPARHASFSAGPFQVTEHEDPRVPPITLQFQEDGHSRLLDRNILQERDMARKVAVDVVNAMAFFQQVYGPLRADRLSVAEIPYAHGQAFPGMIHLSYATWLTTRSSGLDENFRAHEVAHQWWGLDVGEASYRDAWLEEGLSEFSANWYMMKVKADPARVYDLLDEARDDIFDLAGEAGPIWLGRRHGSLAEDGGRHYATIVYQKGAWVFHMLRTLLMDLNSQDDSGFADVMADLFRTHQGGTLSTAGLQEHLERHMGMDMGWFFEQWVYGTALPTYRFSWTGTETDDGRWRMVGKAVQEGVPDDFVAFVPVLLDFGDEGFARVRMRVEGRESTLEFPVMPRRPDAVVFNDLHGVLAKVEAEEWEGPTPW